MPRRQVTRTAAVPRPSNPTHDIWIASGQVESLRATLRALRGDPEPPASPSAPPLSMEFPLTSHLSHLSSLSPSPAVPLSVRLPPSPSVEVGVYAPPLSMLSMEFPLTSHLSHLSSLSPSHAVPLSVRLPPSPSVEVGVYAPPLSMEFPLTSHLSHLSSLSPSPAVPLSVRLPPSPSVEVGVYAPTTNSPPKKLPPKDGDLGYRGPCRPDPVLLIKGACRFVLSE
jgi:hypothetical protein